MLVTMNNIVGGGDVWASNPDGSTQIVTTRNTTPATTEVVFNNIPANDALGLVPFVEMGTAHNPSATPPTIKYPFTYGTPSGGVRTVTIPLSSAINADQDGCTWLLRLIK